jgi:hypothetical protein
LQQTIPAPPDLEIAPATEYARRLLADCGLPGLEIPTLLDADSALEWARSGAMALTGRPGEAPKTAPGPLALSARGAARALARLAPESRALANLDGPALLGERAALSGLERRGSISPGGGCRFLASRDGWLAVNLPRSADRELLPAWLEAEPRPDEEAWHLISRCLPARRGEAWLERAHCLGLAVAPAGSAPLASSRPWLEVQSQGRRAGHPLANEPRVLDLSSLWAGPLCAQLLGLAGARVVKLESRQRPDGARRGPAEFFDLLNGEKASVVLDFAQDDGLRRLRELIEGADIVVESSRPRALEQLGIDAAAWVRKRPGLTWLSITAYGRHTPRDHWVGFGDDVAVAAGAAIAPDAKASPPLFCGDAIADPLTGLHAAVAALARHRSGVGGLLDVSLLGVTAHALQCPGNSPAGVVEYGPAERGGAGGEGWLVSAGRREAVAAPRARRARGRARPFGADNAALLGRDERHGMPGERS